MPFQSKELGDFLGKGITLPLTLTNGKPKLESGFDLIKASIIMILSWKYGTRFFLNEFGSKLYELLEEPNDNVLQNIVQIFIVDAINNWEPRIELLGSSITRTQDGAGMDISITYKIIAIQKEDTFIFPFYRQIKY